MKKLKIIEKISWWIFIRKLRIMNWNMDYKMKSLRRKYCHKGIHKVQRHAYGITDENGTQRVEYLGCAFCEYKFFATQRSMNRYKILTESWARRTTSAFSRMLSAPKRDGLEEMVASKREKSLPDRKARNKCKKKRPNAKTQNRCSAGRAFPAR